MSGYIVVQSNIKNACTKKRKSHGVWQKKKDPHGLFNLVHNKQCFETVCE